MLLAGLMLPSAAEAMSFAPGPGNPVSDAPNNFFNAATGDLDGDGRDEIVSPTDTGIRVYSNDGSGFYLTAPGFGSASVVHLGDQSGDGNLDIVALSGESIAVYLGNGTTTPNTTSDFNGFTNYGNIPDAAKGTSLTDVDADDVPDLIRGHIGGLVSVMLGAEDGSFAAISNPVTLPFTPLSGLHGVTQIATGDYTGDGNIDIAAGLNNLGGSDRSEDGVFLLRGNGQGSFTSDPEPVVTGKYFRELQTGDFDGDDTDDLAAFIQDAQSVGAVRTVLGSAGGFVANAATGGNFGTDDGFTMTAGDFNLDGKTDLVTSGYRSFRAYLGNGAGGFTLDDGATNTLPNVGGDTPTLQNLYTGDFDGDGATDLLAQSNNSNPPHASALFPYRNRPDITRTPASVSFPLTGVGATSDPQVISFTNSGGRTIILGIGKQPQSNDFQLSAINDCGGFIDPGETCEFNVTFTPTSAGLKETGAVMVFDNFGITRGVNLSGTGVYSQATISPSSVNLGRNPLDSTVTRTFTISASGGTALRLGQFSVDGGYTIDDDDCSGEVIPIGEGCEVVVSMNTETTGSRDGTLTATANTASGTVSASLSGSVVDPATTIHPEYHDFGGSLAGGGQFTGIDLPEQTFAIESTGTTTAFLSGPTFTGADADAFHLKAGEGNNTCTEPLAPDETCSVTVVFDPGFDQTGELEAELRFEVDGGADLVADLAGEGTVGDGTLTPTSRDFGEVRLGGTHEETFTVTSTGTGPLLFFPFVTDGEWEPGSGPFPPAESDYFAGIDTDCPLGSGAALLDVGETCELTVEFAPGGPSASTRAPSASTSSPTLSRPPV